MHTHIRMYINSYIEELFFFISGKSVPWYIDYINSIYRGLFRCVPPQAAREARVARRVATEVGGEHCTSGGAGRGGDDAVCVCVCVCVCVRARACINVDRKIDR
jgi:hypothetical protein